jgi:uncharacterized membrane protein
MRAALRVLLSLIASATTLPAVGQAASFTGLGSLPGSSFDVAHGVSADGSTVVGQSNNQAFLWTAGAGMVSIAPPDSDSTEAWSASADGSVVVGQLTRGRDPERRARCLRRRLGELGLAGLAARRLNTV